MLMQTSSDRVPVTAYAIFGLCDLFLAKNTTELSGSKTDEEVEIRVGADSEEEKRKGDQTEKERVTEKEEEVAKKGKEIGMDSARINTGDEVDSYCGQCKLERAHNVVALVDGKVAKVVCKMCGSKHKYKAINPEPNKSGPKSAAGRGIATNKERASGTRRAASAKSKENQWEAAMTEKNYANSRTYSMDGSYDEGEVIEHNKFGHGIIMQVEKGGKMQVLFKDGPKRLICASV